MLGRVKTPSDPQAKALNKLFSGSTFNPKAECVANEAHTKKKKFEGAPKITALKDSAVTVVMLKKYQTRIPRGECRQELTDSNRVQKVTLNRNMTPVEVKEKILEGFGCKDFILECAKGGYLLRAADVELTSHLAIDRRGALYLCENSKPVVNTIVYRSCHYAACPHAGTC